jgi:hypothetical protein
MVKVRRRSVSSGSENADYEARVAREVEVKEAKEEESKTEESKN